MSNLSHLSFLKILLVVSTLAGCNNAQSPTQAAARSPDRFGALTASNQLTPFKFLIDWQAEPTYLGIYYAKEKGYFEKLGYDVQIDQSWGANQATAAIAAGKYQLGTSSGGATVLAYNNGAHIVSMGVLYPKISSVIYGLADEHISKPRDLRGKRIGIFPGSVTNNEFDAFLKENGLSQKDVNTVSLSGSDISILLARKVDAVLHYTEMSPTQVELNSQVSAIDGKRTFELRLSDYGVGGYGLDIISSRESVSQNGAVLEELSEAIVRAYRDGCVDRGDAVKTFVKVFPTKDENYVAASWDKVCALVGPEVGGQTAAGWQRTIDLYRGLGLLSAATVTPSDILPGG